MLFVGVFTDPPFMSLKSFNVQLNSMLGKLQHENKHVYITGDFNVNMLTHIKSSLDRQYFNNILSSSLFSPLITKPAKVTDHSATLIDNIYCNIPEVSTQCKAGILKLSISGHSSIFCISNESLIGNKIVLSQR